MKIRSRSTIAVIFPILAVSAFMTSGCTRVSSEPARNAPSIPSSEHVSEIKIMLSPELIDMGTLEPGQPASAVLAVKNVGQASRTLERFETSCPCIRIGSLPRPLGLGETVTVNIAFEPFQEPDFRGSLAIKLRALDPSGVKLFETEVHVKVSEKVATRPELD